MLHRAPRPPKKMSSIRRGARKRARGAGSHSARIRSLRIVPRVRLHPGPPTPGKFQLPTPGTTAASTPLGLRSARRSCAPSALGATRGRSLPPAVASHPASTDRGPRGSAGRRQPLGRAASSNTALATDGKRLRGANRRPLPDRVPGQPCQRHASPLAPTPNREERSPAALQGRRPRLGDHSRRLGKLLASATYPSRATRGNRPWRPSTGRDASSHFCENLMAASNSAQVLKPLRGLINYSQMFRIERHRVKTGEASIEVTYGLTSLPPGRRRGCCSQPWPLGHREPEPPPPGHDLRRRCSVRPTTLVNHTALAIIFHRGFRQQAGSIRAEAIRAVAEPG